MTEHLASILRRSVNLLASCTIRNEEDVQQRVIRIASAANSGDINTALREEYQLYKETLAAIATRSVGSPSRLAAEALKTLELAYDRGE